MRRLAFVLIPVVLIIAGCGNSEQWTEYEQTKAADLARQIATGVGTPTQILYQNGTGELTSSGPVASIYIKPKGAKFTPANVDRLFANLDKSGHALNRAKCGKSDGKRIVCSGATDLTMSDTEIMFTIHPSWITPASGSIKPAS